MKLIERMKQFNQRWQIQDKETPAESFKKFKTRILNILMNIDNQVSEDSVKTFCLFYGIIEKWEEDYSGYNRWSNNIINKLTWENDETEFYKILEIIFCLNIKSSSTYGSSKGYNRMTLYNEVVRAIEFSNINLATTVTDSKEIIFYPKGEEFLDEQLVNNILSFLVKKSNSHFIDALKFYQSKNWIKSAESMRRSLEEFLRYKFNNDAGLKSNIDKLGKLLKDVEKPAQIKNIISRTFDFVDLYFNDESKHNDGDISENESEFLIYQVGLLMRYIHKEIK